MRWVLLVLLIGVAGGCGHRAVDNSLISNRGADKDRWWSSLPRQGWQSFERVAQSQPWFEVHQVARGVLAIYEPGQFEEVISYLVIGRARALLFDSGLGIGDMRKLVSELTERPVVVLNSHSHYDHIGGNHQFDTVMGVEEPYTLRRSAGLSHGEVKEFVGPGWIWKQTPVDFESGSYSIAPFTIKRYITDGELIELGGRQLEVLLTPGHAPDSLCLIDRDNRILFTGDTFYLAPLYVHLPGADMADYMASVERLATLAHAVDLILPGHNEPVTGSRHLTLLRDAARSVVDGSHGYQLTDGNREYSFGDFSIITVDQ